MAGKSIVEKVNALDLSNSTSSTQGNNASIHEQLIDRKPGAHSDITIARSTITRNEWRRVTKYGRNGAYTSHVEQFNAAAYSVPCDYFGKMSTAVKAGFLKNKYICIELNKKSLKSTDQEASVLQQLALVAPFLKEMQNVTFNYNAFLCQIVTEINKFESLTYVCVLFTCPRELWGGYLSALEPYYFPFCQLRVNQGNWIPKIKTPKNKKVFVMNKWDSEYLYGKFWQQ
ncbi:uncharacterized protein LY89DRAFT_732382 [Mollisia scopiformis]|uniref:Uncharacterized protein n=1 Tax=Mollisia scopiformis TaxID=149040 RepID=A0A194XFC9_MOLSC|nr:uncharacterized protein LY89DRAFT_732382 [Mollisia scopiformis]KUJ18839.1 hypothetical protein LY89DRAFT_732382 [Mollisia scopiformis]